MRNCRNYLMTDFSDSWNNLFLLAGFSFICLIFTSAYITSDTVLCQTGNACNVALLQQVVASRKIILNFLLTNTDYSSNSSSFEICA
jgi:hypothetical protein